MAIITLAIQCEDEDDVNDVLYLLFGPADAADKFGEEVETFGDFVGQHNSALTRSDDE